MTSGGNNFNDYREIVPTREITTKIEKNFMHNKLKQSVLVVEVVKCCIYLTVLVKNHFV